MNETHEIDRFRKKSELYCGLLNCVFFKKNNI